MVVVNFISSSFMYCRSKCKYFNLIDLRWFSECVIAYNGSFRQNTGLGWNLRRSSLLGDLRQSSSLSSTLRQSSSLSSTLRQSSSLSSTLRQSSSLASTLRQSLKLVPTWRRSSYLFWDFTKKDLGSIFFVIKSRSYSCFTMKLESEEFNAILTNDLQVLFNVFNKYGYKIRIAGGAVRDLLAGSKPNDIDFATDATPDQMKEMFTKENIRMINAKGEKHGTVTARINTENFEVTTLRIDVVTDGRHAEVEFTKDWELDANRRDFTVNSMFLGHDGTIYDYCDGYNDLLNKKIRFVGDAQTRIREDYLRILRYFRFYGKICISEDQHDEETLKIISDNIEGLQQISGERIWSELKKILVGNYAASLVGKLIECGAGKFIGFPEKPLINNMKLLELTKSFNLEPVSVVSSLFCNQEEFLTFNSRCKLSNQDKYLGLFLIEMRDKTEDLKFYKVLFLTPKQPPVSKFQITELFKYKNDLIKLEEFEKWDVPKLPVNGTDLLKHGVPQGKQLGNIMNQLKLRWIAEDFTTDRDQLVALIPSIADKLKIKLNKK